MYRHFSQPLAQTSLLLGRHPLLHNAVSLPHKVRQWTNPIWYDGCCANTFQKFVPPHRLDRCGHVEIYTSVYATNIDEHLVCILNLQQLRRGIISDRPASSSFE